MARARVHLRPLEERIAPSVSLVTDINRDLFRAGYLIAVNDTVLFRSDPNDEQIWRSDGTPTGTGPAEPGVQLEPFGTGVEFAGAYYFRGFDPAHGEELWRTDGTPEGTRLVRDTLAGPSSGYPGLFTVAGDTLYFVANGNRLWRSDGTTAGTVPIRRIGIRPPVTDGIEELASAGDRVYLRVDGVRGGELWTSDGTRDGTHLVADLFAAGGYRVRSLLGAADGSFYFSAASSGSRGLWVTDGTAAGTKLVRDDVTASGPAAALGGKLYFVALDATGDKELWVTDGTATGTTLVKDINETKYGRIEELAVHGSYLYFGAADASTGRELWRTDGTADGTIRLGDLYPGAGPSDPEFLTPAEDGLYFTAITPTSGKELWKTDGTPEATIQVADLEPGPDSSFPIRLVSTGDRVFWVGNTTADGSALWVAGAGTGPTLLSPVPAATASSIIGPGVTVDGVHYFTADHGAFGREVWRTDGTAAGTWLLKDIAPGADSSWAAPLTAVGSTLYISVNTPDAGQELWVSDGTTDGTRLVKEIDPGIGNFFTAGLLNPTAFQGKLIFTTTTPDEGRELWVSDGTADGTRLLKDIDPGNGSAFFEFGDPKFTELNGYLYFAARDAVHGLEIWRTDGTEVGTTLVTDLPTPWIGLPEYPHNVVTWSPERVGNRILFWGRSGTDVALWATDGTASGTVMISELLPVYRYIYGGGLDIPSYYIDVLDDRVVLGDRMLFWAKDSAHPVALWATDGTPEGTTLVSSIRSDGDLFAAGGLAYFRNSSGHELWRTDGTAAGTFRLRTFSRPGGTGVDLGGQLVFFGHDRVHGHGLWTSDGTVAGTRRVKDLVAGPERGFESTSRFVLGETLYFGVKTGSAWGEPTLWRSDGTAEGTHPIAEGHYSGVAELNGAPIFIHNDGLTGTELWRYDPITTAADHYNLKDRLRLDVPAATGLLTNDADGGGQPLTATLLIKPKNGWLTLRPDGSFFYQSFSRDFSGTDNFTYHANAAGEQSPPVTVSIDADLENQAPLPADDTAAGRAGRAVTVRVLANDADPDNDTLSIASFTQGTNGRVTRVGNALVYTPRVAGAQSDTFTYTVRDQRGATATATVTVNLTVATAAKVTAVRLFPSPGTGSINLVAPGSRILPFQRFARIELAFSADVSLAADDLRLIGADGGPYALSGFTYDSATRTASWLIDGPAAPTRADRLTVLLDGSAATGVTGPGGVAIGDWTRTVSLLVGDVNGDGQVTAADRVAVQSRFGPVSGVRRLFADVNGDGIVDAADVDLVAANVGGRRV